MSAKNSDFEREVKQESPVPGGSRATTPLSQTSALTEKMRIVDLVDSPRVQGSTPNPHTAGMNRDQLRLFRHICSKFDVTEVDAAVTVLAKPCKRRRNGPATQEARENRHELHRPNPLAKRNPAALNEPASKHSSTTPRNNHHPHSVAKRNSAAPSGPRNERRESHCPAPATKRTSAVPPATEQAVKRPRISMAKALKIRRIGIIRDTPFNSEEAEDIKESIVQLVKIQKSTMPPEFHGIALRNGQLIATVADEESVQWLLRHDKDLAHMSKCDLKAVVEEEIPPTSVYRGSFAHSANDTNEDIFDTILSFTRNEAMSTASWRVTHRVNHGSIATLFIVVDLKSHEHIEAQDRLLPFRIGHVKLHLLEDEEKNELKEQVDKETVATQPSLDEPSTSVTSNQDAAATRPNMESPVCGTKAVTPKITKNITPKIASTSNKPSSNGIPKQRGKKEQQTIQESMRKSERAKKSSN